MNKLILLILFLTPFTVKAMECNSELFLGINLHEKQGIDSITVKQTRIFNQNDIGAVSRTRDYVYFSTGCYVNTEIKNLTSGIEHIHISSPSRKNDGLDLIGLSLKLTWFK